MFSLLGALAGCDRTGLELELAVLSRQPELHLRAARLFADGGHLPRQVGLETVEIETRRIARGGGQALVEGFGRFRIDALAEDDPLLGVVALRLGVRDRPGGGVPSF